MKPFLASNPTWIKNASATNAVLEVPFLEIVRAFREEILWMRGTMSGETVNDTVLGPPVIELAHSAALPGDDERFDVVVSSPLTALESTNRRNSIAHGADDAIVRAGDYERLQKSVFQAMDLLVLTIIDAIERQSYLRQVPISFAEQTLTSGEMR